MGLNRMGRWWSFTCLSCMIKLSVSLTMLKYCLVTKSMRVVHSIWIYVKIGYACVFVCVRALRWNWHRTSQRCAVIWCFDSFVFVFFFLVLFCSALLSFALHAFVLSSSWSSSLQWLGIFSTLCGYYDVTIPIASWCNVVHITVYTLLHTLLHTTKHFHRNSHSS